MPALPTAQVHPAPSVHLLPLALHEPAASQAGQTQRRHLQLQRGQLLHQVRRDDGHLSRRRRVSSLLFWWLDRDTAVCHSFRVGVTVARLLLSFGCLRFRGGGRAKCKFRPSVPQVSYSLRSGLGSKTVWRLCKYRLET